MFEEDFTCNRCLKSFSDKQKLLSHRKYIRDKPCDFVCYDCGNILYTRQSYDKHIKSKCTYFPKYIKHKVHQNNVTQNQVNNIDNSNTTINNNNINININLRGLILPHTSEMKMEKQQLLGEIVEKILSHIE